MNAKIIDTTEPTEAEIKAKGAEEHLEQLRQELAASETEAIAAREAFENDPTPDTLTRREIGSQKAKNAQVKWEKFSESIAEIRAGATREIQRRELQRLRAMENWREGTAGPGARIQTLYRDFMAGAQKEIDLLVAFLEERNKDVPQLRTLERTVGDGRNHRTVTLTEVLEFINANIERDVGKRSATGDAVQFASIRQSPRVPQHTVMVELQFQLIKSGLSQGTLVAS